MSGTTTFPECPTHGGRIVTRDDFDAEIRRRDPVGWAVLPRDADIGFALSKHPRATVREGFLRCDECHEVAAFIHLLPGEVEVACIQAACPAHDFGGYAIPLASKDGLLREPFRLLHHLSLKQQSEATLLTLMTWLGFDGAVALDSQRAA